MFFYSLCFSCKAIELSDVPNEFLINNQLNILLDSSADLSFQHVFKQYQAGKFTKNTDGKVSFGFTRDVIWASVLISHSSPNEIKKIFYLDSAWLDRADFYFIRQDEVVDKAFLGDTLLFSERQNQTRMLSQPYSFKSGATTVLMRFESKDPLLIPLYLTSEEIIQSRETTSSYFYGFLYGAFFILLVYNIVLAISLRDSSYVFYSLYLLSFLSLNIAYTGHGFKYIWSNNLFIQQWAMILFLYFYVIFGIAFCFEFLKLNVYLPKVYRMKNWLYSALVLLMISTFVNGEQLFAVKVGVALTSLIVVIFISLGLFALKNGHNMAKFFMPAAFMGAGGAAISAATTWGAIPYNALLFHSIEVGMLVEMSILALTLAFNLKEIDKARLIAEVNAQVDYLTGLYNRRAFIAAVTPLWHLGIREQQGFSMILVDIDWFKRINDEYGHAAGDAVLKNITHALEQKVRKSDVLARWGGEEFIIFLPNTTKAAAVNLANIIRKKNRRYGGVT